VPAATLSGASARGHDRMSSTNLVFRSMSSDTACPSPADESTWPKRLRHSPLATPGSTRGTVSLRKAERSWAYWLCP